MFNSGSKNNTIAVNIYSLKNYALTIADFINKNKLSNKLFLHNSYNYIFFLAI
jgi:hypothetical protein